MLNLFSYFYCVCVLGPHILIPQYINNEIPICLLQAQYILLHLLAASKYSLNKWKCVAFGHIIYYRKHNFTRWKDLKKIKTSNRSGPGQHRWTYIMVNILLFLIYPYYILRNRFKYSIHKSVHKKCKTLGMVRLKIIFATYTMTTNLKCVLLKQKWRQSWEGE